MVAFHEALKISAIPFPLPYVQACDWMLVLHYIFLPLVLPQWVGHSGWAFAFCFIQVFILWALKFTASEIENPFGMDANDLDRKHLQREMNGALKFLVQPAGAERFRAAAASPWKRAVFLRFALAAAYVIRQLERRTCLPRSTCSQRCRRSRPLRKVPVAARASRRGSGSPRTRPWRHPSRRAPRRGTARSRPPSRAPRTPGPPRRAPTTTSD